MNRILPTIITFLSSQNNMLKEKVFHFLEIEKDNCVLLPNTSAQKSKTSMKSFVSAMLLLFFVSFANAATRYSVANGNWNAPLTWATTQYGTPGASVPVAGDVVYIRSDHTITVTAAAACGSITFTGVSGGATNLVVNSTFSLVVGSPGAGSGIVTVDSSVDNNRACTISGGGTLSCASVVVGTDVAPPTYTPRSTIMTSAIANFNITANLAIFSYIGIDNTAPVNSTFNLESGTVNIDGQITTTNENAVNITSLSMASGAQSGTLLLGNVTPFSLAGSGTNSINLNGTATTVNYDGVAQTVRPTTYTNLTLSSNGTKRFSNTVTIRKNLSVVTGVVADLGTFSHTANALTLGGATASSGTWGNTASPATNKNDVYFAPTSGIVTVASSNCTAYNASITSSPGICNGSTGVTDLKVTLSGGVGPYTVVVRNEKTGVNTTVTTYVSGGAISVTPVPTVTKAFTLVSVTDANGCLATLASAYTGILFYSAPPTPTATAVDVNCPTDATGTITVTNATAPASLAFTNTNTNSGSVTPVSSHIDFGQPLLSARKQFTAEGWIKFDQSKYVNRMSLFGQNDVVEFGFESNRLRCWTARGGSVDLPLTSYPTDNQWHHIAVVGNGAKLTFYLDGLIVANGGSSVGTGDYGSSAFTTKIGWGVMDAGGIGLTGEVFKLGFWGRALTQAELTGLASGFVTYDVSQVGLLSGYSFNEGSGTTVSGVGSVAPLGTLKSNAVWKDPYSYSWTKTASAFTSNAIHLTGLTPGTYNLTTSLKGCTKTESWEVKATAASPTTPMSLAIVPACSSTLVINWNAVANATSYGIQLSEDSGFLTPVTVGVVTYDGKNDKGNVNTYSVTGLKLNTTYYYKIWAYNSCGSAISTSYTTVTGKGDAIWSSSSWDVTPTNQHHIVFAADYTSSGNLEGCSCEVRPNVQVTIPAGNTLSLINGLTIDTAAGTRLTFEDTASLWQENDAAVNKGAITYKRKSSFMKLSDYTYWSSPVKDQNTKVLSPNTETGKFYSFVNNNWKPAYNVTMEPGVGYIIRTPKAGTWSNGEVVAFPYKQPVQFVGEPNNGDQIKFVLDPIAGRKNLIGNPYPSALDANAFLLANQDILEGTIYFWTHNTAIQQVSNITNGTAGSGFYAYTSDDYAAYNSLGGVGGIAAKSKPDPNNAVGGDRPSGKIGAGQSFMAVTKVPGIVSFKNSMREKALNAQFFKQAKNAKTTAAGRQRVWLNLTNTQGAFKQTLVGYIKGATNGYEDFFDGISNNGNNFVDFYSINDNTNLVIQGRALPFDPADVVPLGYSSKIEGTFAISIDEVDGDLSNQAIFIEDKETQTIHDLKSGSYSFTTKKGTFNERFTLRYTNKTLGSGDFETTDNAVVVTVKNKQLKVHSAIEAIDTVLVYDLSGRQLYKKERLNSTEVTVQYIGSGTQALVVKVVLENGKVLTKKVIY
jgi:hypothetical protein